MTVTCQHQAIRYRFLIRTCVCYVALAGGLALWAWPAATLPEAAKPGLMALGLLTWTLIEYLLHRFLLHSRPQPPAFLSMVEKLRLGHHRSRVGQPAHRLRFAGAVSARDWKLATGGSAHDREHRWLRVLRNSALLDSLR